VVLTSKPVASAGTSTLAWVLALAALSAMACAPIHRARLDPSAPPSEVELDAAERLADPACSAKWSLLLPGVGQLCTGKTGEGAVITALSVAEIGTAAALATKEERSEGDDAALLVTMVALQNTWIYASVDPLLDRQRAALALYTPQDSLADLAFAPFNPEVLSEPVVWGGILGTFALALGYTMLRDPHFRLDRVNSPSDTFGDGVHPALGYTAAGVGGAGMFTHVAIGEEVMFRGLVQSSLAANVGEWEAWGWGSLVFGTFHIPNALLLDAKESTDYITYDVPFVTSVGAYLGLAYMWSDYSLTAPVAIHFWYDFLLSASHLVFDPSAPVVIRWAVPF
jgi:membrane protease YdiL (CAAX protease family)